MRALWAEAKRRLKTSAAFLLAALAAAGLAVWYALRRQSRGEKAAEKLDAIFDTLDQKIAAANARAAIEVHVARSKEAAVVAELKTIDADPDGERRRQALVDLAARVEGRSP